MRYRPQDLEHYIESCIQAFGIELKTDLKDWFAAQVKDQR